MIERSVVKDTIFMLLRSLKLTNFRNYSSFQFNFSPLTIFIGPNGIGKTNLIEAIYLLSIGKSFRTRKDQEVIQWGKDFSKIKGKVIDEHLELIITRLPYQQKIIKINQVRKKPPDLLGKLKIVLFSPESMEIITGSPRLRRRFLDLILGQIDQNYLKNLIELQKVLRNRNHLLLNIKEKKSNLEELSFWDQKLIDLASQLIEKRKKLIVFINKKIDSFYQQISGQKEELKLKYLTTVNDPARYPDLLHKNQVREISYCSTLFGPHRDDLKFLLQGKEVNNFASRGEIRSIIFALKMTELEFLKEKGTQPLLLLDDIFSELDKKRREKLCGVIENQPTIITATEIGFLNPEIKKKAKIVELKEKNVAEN